MGLPALSRVPGRSDVSLSVRPHPTHRPVASGASAGRLRRCSAGARARIRPPGLRQGDRGRFDPRAARRPRPDRGGGGWSAALAPSRRRERGCDRHSQPGRGSVARTAADRVTCRGCEKTRTPRAEADAERSGAVRSRDGSAVDPDTSALSHVRAHDESRRHRAQRVRQSPRSPSPPSDVWNLAER